MYEFSWHTVLVGNVEPETSPYQPCTLTLLVVEFRSFPAEIISSDDGIVLHSNLLLLIRINSINSLRNNKID